MANAWEIYQKQSEDTGRPARITQSANPWQRYRESEAYSKAPKGNHRIDREKQKSTAQQKYEEALKRADDAAKKNSTGIADIRAFSAGNYDDGKEGRFEKTFNAAAEGTAAAYTNVVGTLLEGLKHLNDAAYKSQHDHQIKAQENSKAYWQSVLDNATTDEERERAQKQIDHADYVLRTYQENMEQQTADVKKASEKTYKKADELQEKSATHTQEAKEDLGKAGQLLVDVGVNGGQMLGDAAINLIVPGAGLAALGARSFGSSAQEARQGGANYGEQILYSGLNAATEVLTEKMFDGLAGIYGKSALKDTKLAAKVGRTVDKAMGKLPAAAKKILSSMGGEAVEELVAGAIEPAYQYIYDGEGYNEDTVSDIFNAMIVGGLLGGIGGSVETVGTNAENRRVYAPDTEAAQALVDEALAIDPNNKTALKAAERLKKGKNISGGTVTQLVDQNDRIINQNAAMKKAQKTQESYMRALEEYDEAQSGTAQTGGTETDGTAIVQRTEDAVKIPESVMAEGPAAVRTYRKFVEAKEKMEAAERQSAENTAQNATESAQERFGTKGVLQPTATQKTPQTAQEAYMRAVARVDGVQTMTEEQTAQENAAKYGENARTYLAAQKVSTLSAADFEDAWSIAYAQGAAAPSESLAENYAALRSAMRTEYTEDQISDTVMEHAFYLGHEEGAKNYEATESNLHEGGQWDDGARADGQAGAVAEGAEKAGRKAKDKEAKRLKSRAFRKEDLTEGVKAQATAQIVTEGETESMRRAKAIGAERGLEVHFFRGGDLLVNGSYANGCICDGEVWVRADDPDFTAEQIMRHEAMHDAIEKGEVDPYEIWTKLEQRFGVDRMDGYVEAYGEAVSGIGLSEMEIEEEIICDAAGGMNKFAGKLDLLAAEYGEVLEDAAQEVRAGTNTERGPPEGTKNTATNGGVKGSRVTLEDKYYARQIDQWDGKDHGGAFRVGKVSKPLIDIGVPDVDIWFDQSKAAAQLLNKSEITKDVLKQIPSVLERPVAISESYDNTVMVFGRVFDAKRNPIVIALRVNSTNRRNHVTLVNKIRSVGTRSHNLDKLLSEDSLLYLSKNKKETVAWFNALGRSTPFGGTKFGLIRSISFQAEKSNRKIKASAVVRNDTVAPIEKRLRGDALLDAQDLIDTVMDVGGEVDGNGYITVYHRTNAENAANIRRTGVMTAKEDGLFFSTKETGYNDGYGDTVVKLRIPAEEMLLDDIFDDEAHLRIPLKRIGGKWQLNVSGYLADTENRIIHFSANGTAEVAALEAQNNALKEQIRQLNREKDKLQKQVESKTAQVNKWKNKATFSPERVGKDIIRAYQSTVAEPEIHDDIESLIAYAGKAGSSISYGRMKEMAAGVAKKIVHHAETIVNGDVTQEYDAIRAYHRQVKLEVSPALKRDFADWGKWWQENGRKLHIVNSTKSNVDMIYAELREQFGEGYYPEDLIYPADQLRRMAEVLDSLQPIVENPHSYNMAYAAEACANDLADMVMQEVSRGYAGTITYQLNEQLYRAKQEAREMAQRAIRAESAQRDDARAQIYAERLQRWETEEKRAARRKIAATVRTLDRALRNPTDSNHIPDELRGTVQELCSIFTHNRAEVLQQGEKITVDDHAIFDADKLEKARAYYAELKETEEFGEVYDEETKERLKSLEENIAGKRLSALTLEELRDVKAVVEHIRFIARTADEMFINGRKAKIQSVAQGIMIRAGQKGHHEEFTLKNGKKIDLKRMIKEGNLKPEYFFRRIDDTALSNLWHDILRGQDTYGKAVAASRAFYEKTYERFGVGEWFDGKRKLQMKDAAGNYMTVSMDQAMYMTAAYKRERLNGNTNHVLGGGFVVESVVVKEYKILGEKVLEKRRTDNDAHTMNEQTMEKVEKWLAEQDSRILPYVDAMVAYLSDEMAAKGNETSMRLHGYKKFLEKYYIPMQSSREFLKTRFDSNKTNSGTNYKNKGMTKRTTQGANNPIVLRDFHEVWAQHVNEMILYNAMAVEQDNLQRIMNYKTPVDELGNMPSDSVKAALTNAYSEGAVQYIDTLMRDINGGLVPDSREAGVNSMIALFKKNAVFASLSVFVQQYSSIARAMAVMDGKYLVRTVRQKRNYEELKRYSGVAVIKEMGGFDTTTGRSGANWIMEKLADKTAREKLDKAGAYLPGKMDEAAWCHIWNAVKAEIADTTDLAPGSEAYFERCGQRFNEVIELTQVYDSVLTRSENMRSQSGLVKVATAFMAEPTVTLNMMAEAMHNVRIKKSGAKKQLLRTMSAVLIGLLLNNLLKAIVTAPRDKDEDKTILEKYAGKFASGMLNDINPLTYIPVVADIWDVLQGYTVEASYMQPIADAYFGVKSLLDDTDQFRALWIGDWSGVTVDGVADAVNGIAGLFGVPAKNVWRDLRGVATLFKETAPIKDTTFQSVVDAAWESLAKSKTTTERVEDYYYAFRGKSALKQRNATKDMEKLWERFYNRAVAEGCSKKEAESKANSSVKRSVTSFLKPKYQAAKTQAERNAIVTVARHLYLGGHQLYNGYDFAKNWAAED